LQRNKVYKLNWRRNIVLLQGKLQLIPIVMIKYLYFIILSRGTAGVNAAYTFKLSKDIL